MKKSSGEILAVNRIFEKFPQKVKNFGISLRYRSRSNEVNIYKEFRDVSRVGAVEHLLSDMGGRHRTTYRRLQIMEVKSIPAKACRRTGVKQFHNSKIKFPLPHRVDRAPTKRYRAIFKAHRPNTHKG
jgi:large subunit ribosomal protein L18Ae